MALGQAVLEAQVGTEALGEVASACAVSSRASSRRGRAAVGSMAGA